MLLHPSSRGPERRKDGDRGEDRIWFLTESIFWRLAAATPARAIALGCMVFVLVLVAIALSPSSDSRFIYTDF